MTVDLNTCVPGQQCITGDGRCLAYVKKINNDLHYPHLLLDQDSVEETFTNDGIYDIRNLNGKYNIVRIIPMESTASDKHPSIAWWESCPWITDRQPTKEDGNVMGWVMTKPTNSSDAAWASWSRVETSQPWIHRSDWQPPVLSDKEKALELLNKHEAANYGVWVPTPDDWNVIRKGLTD